MRHSVLRALGSAAACGLAASALAAAPAHAATDPYSAFVWNTSSASEPTIYNFINSATKSIDMTMYELVDTTAVNDLVADGRDLSWLWDVDFSPLAGREVALTTGVRAVDMALRLRYDDVAVGRIEPDLRAALAAIAQSPGETVVFATYTAMLRLHALLSAEAVTAR